MAKGRVGAVRTGKRAAPGKKVRTKGRVGSVVAAGARGKASARKAGSKNPFSARSLAAQGKTNISRTSGTAGKSTPRKRVRRSRKG